jgi:hypothetical protein
MDERTVDDAPPMGANVYVTSDEAEVLTQMLRDGAARAWAWLVKHEGKGSWAALNEALDAGEFVIVHPCKVYSQAQTLEGASEEQLAALMTASAAPRYSFTRYEPEGRIVAHLVIDSEGLELDHCALGYLESKASEPPQRPTTRRADRLP